MPRRSARMRRIEVAWIAAEHNLCAAPLAEDSQVFLPNT